MRRYYDFIFKSKSNDFLNLILIYDHDERNLYVILLAESALSSLAISLSRFVDNLQMYAYSNLLL